MGQAFSSSDMVAARSHRRMLAPTRLERLLGCYIDLVIFGYPVGTGHLRRRARQQPARRVQGDTDDEASSDEDNQV